nr:hypothetical protein [Candidatus Njordarchaeota archaeon]
MADGLPWFVVLLINILVSFVVLWLSVRLVAGARKTSDKLAMILLVALIGILLMIALGMVPVIGGLSSIVAYTIVIVLVHSLVDIAWDKSILIAFIFCVIMYILSFVISPVYLGPLLP